MPPFDVRRSWERYWLVDPLDGTKEFVNRNGEFTVNIALIEGQQPGARHRRCARSRRMFTWAFRVGARTACHGPMASRSGLSSTAGAGMTSHRWWSLPAGVTAASAWSSIWVALEETFGAVSRTPVGSSLKLCILAEGAADLYPRLGPTSEWDIAAAHAVLTAAGGEVWAVDGSPLAYNAKESVLNPEFFAAADGEYPWRARLPVVPDK